MKLKKSRKFILVKFFPMFLILLIIGAYSPMFSLILNGHIAILYVIVWVFVIFLLERDARYGRGIVYFKIDAQKAIEGTFQNKVEGEIIDLFNILGNKSLFHLFNIERLIASNKYDWDDNNRFFRKEIGWHRTYKSSKKALLRYSYKYQEVFDSKFQIFAQPSTEDLYPVPIHKPSNVPELFMIIKGRLNLFFKLLICSRHRSY